MGINWNNSLNERGQLRKMTTASVAIDKWNSTRVWRSKNGQNVSKYKNNGENRETATKCMLTENHL